jgi:putative hemolysin
MAVILSVVFTLILIIINGYFAMSELALIRAKRAVLQQIIEAGSKDESRKAQRAAELAQDSDRLLATTQIAITLVGFLASAVAAASFSGDLVAWLSGFGLAWLATAAPVIAVVITTLVVSYVTLVLGELVPKRMALANAEKMAMVVSGPVRLFERILSPVVTLLSISTNAVARLFGIRSASDAEAVSEDEIKYLVKEQDTLLDEEKRMINEIFDLGDTVVREIMTPRVDMICVEEAATVRAVLEVMRDTGFSRVPVMRDSPDTIVGVVILRDLIAPLLEQSVDESVMDYARKPVFIPETKDILPLLGEMQTSKMQIALVVDEYGGTAGLVSMEDIVEEIVGDISDEYDPDAKYQTQLSSDEWLIDGRLPVDDAIALGLPLEDAKDYETIAGWLLDEIDSMPQIGESFEVAGFVFKVQRMRRNRIAMLRVTRLPVPEGEEDDDKSVEQLAAV